MTEKPFSIPYMDAESISDTERSFDKRNDGGRKAWMTVFGSFLVYYASFGVVNSFGFFQNYYQEVYLTAAPPATISIIGTLQLALMNCLAVVTGGICDAHGIKYLYISSGLGTSVAFLALSFCRRGVLWQILLIQGLFMGCMVALGVQPACTVVAQHFNNRRAIAMSLVSAGSATGGVCFALMFTQLQPLIGFSWTMRVAAVKVLACYSIALWISSDSPSGKKIRIDALIDFHGFLDIRYAVLALGGSLAQLGLWIPGFHIRSYACTTYPEKCNTIGQYFLPLMSGSSIPGMIVGGLLGDFLGRLNILYPMTFLSGFACLSLWLLSPSASVLAVFASLFGFSSGAVVSLLPPVVTQIIPDDKIGARMGAFYSVISITTLTGAPVGGALLGNGPRTKDTYRSLIVFSGAAMMTGWLVLVAARLLHDRKLRAKW